MERLTGTRYTRVAIGLHWLMAAGLAANFTLGVSMADLPLSPAKLRLVSWHKWAGITLLLMATLRLAWRITHPPPARIARSEWQESAASMGHGLLYLLMFAVPLSGWAMSSAAGIPVSYLGLVNLPMLTPKDRALMEALRTTHFALNLTLATLVTGHIAMALKHAFIDKDRLLARMAWRRHA